jgi:hypothetical protein
MHAVVAMADGGATRGWLDAATRAALIEVGGIEFRTVRLGAINGLELEGPRLPRGPPHEAVSVGPVPVSKQLTVRVEAGRSSAAETDLVINIIKHDQLTRQGPMQCILGLYRWLFEPEQTDHAMTVAVDKAMQAVALETGVCKHDMVFTARLQSWVASYGRWQMRRCMPACPSCCLCCSIAGLTCAGWASGTASPGRLSHSDTPARIFH